MYLNILKIIGSLLNNNNDQKNLLEAFELYINIL